MHIPARREFKYFLDRDRLPELRAVLSGLCERDPFAGPDGSYRIRSLYFDTFDCRLFWANEREAPRRFKARVRSYPDAPGSPVFAEIKGRDGDVIRKTRAKLPADRWQGMLEGTEPLGKYGTPGLDNFLMQYHRFHLKPFVLVDYSREAWMSLHDDYARVSIDGHIVCQGQGELSLVAHGEWRPIDTPLPTFMPSSICVVELKWADQAPLWMADLVQRMELIRHAFSKYCYSMMAQAEDHWAGYRHTASPWS